MFYKRISFHQDFRSLGWHFHMRGLVPAPPEFVFLTSSQGSGTLLGWAVFQGPHKENCWCRDLLASRVSNSLPRWSKALVQLHLLRNCLKPGQGTRLRMRYEGGLCAHSNGTHRYSYRLIRKWDYQLANYVCMFYFCICFRCTSIVVR